MLIFSHKTNEGGGKLSFHCRYAHPQKKKKIVPRPDDFLDGHLFVKEVDQNHNKFVCCCCCWSQIQRIVLATQETTVTKQVSHRPIKCQSRLRSQKDTKVNGSHRGNSPLPTPTGIQIATNPLPGPTNREYRKRIGFKTISLGTSYSSYCLECCQYFRI